MTLADLTRHRGDTFANVFEIKDPAGNAQDITGYSFVMEVDERAEPTGASQRFSINGVITDAPNGLVSFEPTALQADQPADALYYRIVVTDPSSRVRTYGPAPYKFIT